MSVKLDKYSSFLDVDNLEKASKTFLVYKQKWLLSDK